MKQKDRNRIVRSVTLDGGLVERLRKLGPKMMPPETNFSRLLDQAMADLIVKMESKLRDKPRKS